MKNILVTGGAGYVGNLLVPRLVGLGHNVTVYDIMWFDKGTLPKHGNVKVVDGDIRDTAKLAACFQGIDIVLHLACVSNDPSFDLNENLSTTINFECFEPMVIAAKKAGVSRFVYCSSSSVYGVSDQPDVTEEHPLLPLTLYNKFKGMCEPLLFKHMSDDFTCVTIRPATVCGYSPRTRLDLSVNILTNHAVSNRLIKVFGGTQMRPNLHIGDMCRAYELMIEAPKEKIQGEIFNIGFQNMSIADIAQVVKRVVEEEMPEKKPIKIETTPSNDNRSYHINSDKITRVLGFRPTRNIEDAVRDLCGAFRRGKLPNSMTDDWYYNVKTLQAIKAK
ncbi:MAG: SDR family oxidoreductase [Alphaproteobacteria bacterium]|nr:SDR family oxidoreductase [Alphaproteobacteria bacterium]